MKPLEELKSVLLAKAKSKYPSMAEHLLPINIFTKVRNPEKRELKRIVAYLNATGNMARIVENKGTRIDRRKHYVDAMGFNRTIGSVEYRPSSIRNGTADISASIRGRTVEIELKRVYKNGKDRQSKAQKDYQRDVESSGGQYWIVTDFGDFLDKYLVYLQ